MRITVVGADTFLHTLAKVERALAGPAIESGLSAAANHLEGLVKVNIHAQNLIDTGNLLGSIQAERPVVGGGIGSVQVGTNVEYAMIHEYGGTINHPGGTPYVNIGGRVRFIRKDGAYPKNTRFTRPHPITIPARPYLRPAADEHQPEIVQAFIGGFTQEIVKAAS